MLFVSFSPCSISLSCGCLRRLQVLIRGNAEVATLDGKVVGAANVGQMFTKDIYFWGRPSSAGDGYDASSSSGSNKGPTNQEYLDEVKARIDTFLVHHPYLNRADVPAEMVTASASGTGS